MRKIIRIFGWVLAAFVLLSAGLLTYLRSADLSVYQRQIESFVSSRIGHEVKVGGRFELQFGPTTTLIADEVSLSNPGWAPDSELISVGHLQVVVDTWSVFGSPFVIERLDVDTVRAQLARDEQGKLNWVAELAGGDDSGSEGFDPNRIAFRSVNITDVEFVYTDPARQRPLAVVLDNLAVSPDPNDILDLDVTGTVNELPLWADGKLGPWQNFIDGQDIFADLDVSLGQVRLALDGTIADLVRLEGVEINGNLSGPDIGRVLDRLAVPPFTAGAFEIVANVQQYVDGHQVRLDGNVGDIELFVSGSIDSLLNPQEIAHDFSINGPSIGRVVELFGIEDAPQDPFQVSGDYSRSGRVLRFENALLSMGVNAISFNGKLDLSRSAPDWDLRIDANGPNFSVVGPFLGVSGLPREPFTVFGHVQKDESKWLAENVDISVGENRLTVNGQIETGSSSSTEINFEASGPNIAFIQEFTDLQGIPARPYSISATVRPDPLGILVDDGVGVFGENRVEVDGVVALQPGLDGTALDVVLSGPDLHNVRLLTDVPYLPAGPFDVSGRVRFSDDRLLLENAEASVAELEAAADGAVGIGGNNAGSFNLDIVLSGPDVAALPEVKGFEEFRGDSFSVTGNLVRQGERISAAGLEVTLGELEANLDGYVIGPGRLADVSVSANTTDTEVVRKLAKLAYLPEGVATLDGKIEKTETDIRFTNTTLSIGGLRAMANGTLSLSPRSNDSDLAFEIAGPSLQRFGRAFGISTMSDRDFSVSGQFHGTSSGFAMNDFVLTVGDSDLNGRFDANLKGKPVVVGVLTSRRLDLTYALSRPSDDLQNLESEPEPESEKANARLFSSEPLSTSWLSKANVDISLAVDRLIANTLNVTDVNVGFSLVDGALRLDPVNLRETDGSISGRFYLAPENEGYAMDASVTIDDMHVGLLVDEDDPLSSLPTLTGQLQLSGSGDSIRSIMASANGEISFRQGSGKVKEVFGSVLFKDVLLQVLRTLNPMRRSRDYQILECGIYNVTIRDGLFAIDDFIIQTDTMTTVARGEVNLASEELDIAFRAKPREGIGISLGTVANQLLELRGTLTDPRIRVDAGRTATTTGAAVATGGLSLLARGLWDRLSAEADVCEKED